MNGTGQLGKFKKYLLGFTKIAIDTSCFVYEFDEVTSYLDLTGLIFEKIESGKIKAVTSTITILEIFIRPEKEKKLEVLINYENLLKKFPNLQIYPVDWNLARIAARIRAKYRFKTPDAIQLALSVQEKADAFITNDSNLKSFKTVKVLVLKDFVRKRR